MKKIVLSLSMVALVSFAAKAQDPVKKNPTKKEVVNPDGTTTSVPTDEKTAEPTKKDEPKKSGTRMAINEKGTSGTKGTTSKKETAKEDKNETQNSPTSKPH